MRPFFGQDKPLASYEDCYMSTHKRDFPVHLLSQPPSKKQKSSHPPPTFWDNLSQVWLTKGALRELDRRNSRLVQQISPARRIPGPYTRSALTEWKRREENWQPEVSAKEYLSRSLGHLDDIKSFSRHGGPDLSDLRGVSMRSHLIFATLIRVLKVQTAYPSSKNEFNSLRLQGPN